MSKAGAVKAVPIKQLVQEYKDSCVQSKSCPMISPTQRAMDWDLYVYVKKHLLGRVLTIIDASYADTEQRKAIKDLIKAEFYARMSQSRHFFFDGLINTDTTPELDLDS